MDVATDVHGVHELQQGDICPSLSCVVVGVRKDPADGQQLVVVIEVLLPQLHPQESGIYNVPGEKGHLLRGLSSLLDTRQRGWSPRPVPTHQALDTHGPTQCAAVSTHWGWMREPPQTCIQYV